jgi:integrase/recombinase XerD
MCLFPGLLLAGSIPGKEKRCVVAKQIRRRSKKTPVAVSEALQEFLASRQHLSIPTQEDYQWRLRAFATWCAQHQVMLDDITNAIVNDFVDHLKATHKPCKPGQVQLSSYTVSGYVRVIKTFLGWCAEQDEYNPHVQVTEVNKIKKPRVTQTVIDTFTSKQIDLLLDACNQEESDHLQMRARAIVALLVDTGIRASELCSLTVGNIRLDADDAYIRVHGKGDKWGEVGLAVVC